MRDFYLNYCHNPIKRMANEPKMLVLGVLGSWLTVALLFGIIEGTGVVDSLYWGMTTLSTVGYGDLSPATVPGKFLTIAFQAWSIFVLVPCAVANIVDSIRVDEHKQTHEEQEWEFELLEQIARANGIEPKPQPEDY